MRLTDAQIEAALEHYSDPLYPIGECLFVYRDAKTGYQTLITFYVLVRECEERKWWAEQSVRMLKSMIQAFDGKGDPFAIIAAAKQMFEEGK